MIEDERLTEIEIRLSYLERGQETLHESLLALKRDLSGLEGLVGRLERGLEVLRETIADETDEPPPPHY